MVSASAGAEELALAVPVDCDLGVDCFVQNYFDHDASERAMDYTCGPLVYDGYRGTDFRTRTIAQMREGVACWRPRPALSWARAIS